MNYVAVAIEHDTVTCHGLITIRQVNAVKISAFHTIIQRAAPSQVEASRQRSSEARRPQTRLLMTAAGAAAAEAAAAGACSAAAALCFGAPTFPAVVPACAAHPHYSPACQGRKFISEGCVLLYLLRQEGTAISTGLLLQLPRCALPLPYGLWRHLHAVHIPIPVNMQAMIA